MKPRVLMLAAVSMLSLWPALSAADITLSRGVLANGGGGSSGPNHSATGTVGQTCIGVTSGPSGMHLGGFWYTTLPEPSDVPWSSDGLPLTFALNSGQPNPSRDVMTLSFAVPERSQVSIRLYDVTGREVRTLVDGPIDAGYHQLQLAGRGLASGIYFCRMTAPRFSQVRRLVLLN